MAVDATGMRPVKPEEIKYGQEPIDLDSAFFLVESAPANASWEDGNACYRWNFNVISENALIPSQLVTKIETGRQFNLSTFKEKLDECLPKENKTIVLNSREAFFSGLADRVKNAAKEYMGDSITMPISCEVKDREISRISG